MVHDEQLDARIRKIVSSWRRTDAKKMFGGVCHLLNGNMFCGVYKDSLILRLGIEESKRALELPYVRPFDITGRPMKGWVMVSGEGFETDEELGAWLNKVKEWVERLPPSKQYDSRELSGLIRTSAGVTVRSIEGTLGNALMVRGLSRLSGQ